MALDAVYFLNFLYIPNDRQSEKISNFVFIVSSDRWIIQIGEVIFLRDVFKSVEFSKNTAEIKFSI